MQFSSSRAGNAAAEAKGRIYVSGDRMRQELDGVSPSINILDFGRKTVYVLLPAQHLYIEHPMEGARSRRPPAWADVHPLGDTSNPCANQDGTTCKPKGVDELGGRICDHWELTDRNGKVSNVWVDRRLHFPVKTTSEDAIWLLTNVQEGNQDPALFQVPPEFHKMTGGAGMPSAPAQ